MYGPPKTCKWFFELVERNEKGEIQYPSEKSFKKVSTYLTETVNSTKFYGVFYPNIFNTLVTDRELNPNTNKISIPINIKIFPREIPWEGIKDTEIFYNNNNNEKIIVKSPNEWCKELIPITVANPIQNPIQNNDNSNSKFNNGFDF